MELHDKLEPAHSAHHRKKKQQIYGISLMNVNPDK